MAKRYPRDPAYPKPPRWGLLYDKYFPEHTDGASRHTKCIAESMRKPLSPLRALMVEAQYEPDHWASSMEVTVKMLWEARAELAKLGRYGLGIQRDPEIEAEMRKPDGVIVMTRAEMRQFITMHEHPTMRLRWLGGKLQQAFEVRRTQDGYVLSDEIEWRDIPDATQKETP